MRLTALSLIAVVGCTTSTRNSPPSDARPAVSCRLTLEVSGASFSPDECAVEVVIPGVPCGPNVACPPQYSISLKDSVPTHLRQVVLMNFQSLRNGVHSARPAPGQREFDGMLIESNNTVRNLLHGEVTLQQVAGAEALNVDFDLVFAPNVTIRGSGVLAVRRGFAA